MTRNNNIIEDFVDEQLRKYDEIKNKRFTDKYVLLHRITSAQCNTFQLDEVDFDITWYNKSIKNILSYHKDFLDSTIEEKRKNYDYFLFVSSKKDYDEFYVKLKKFVDKKLDKFFSYLKENSHLKIHVSVDKVNLKEFKYFEKTWTGGGDESFYYNPVGLWYSCGSSFYEYIYNDALKNDFRYKNFHWLPLHVYSLDLDEIKIEKINSCKKFYKFSSKYKNKNITKTYIDWKKVYQNLDGLEICPYLTPKCSGLNKLNNKLNIEGLVDHMDNILLKGDLSKKEKSTLWALQWSAATGVILKNFDKVKYKKLRF